MSNARLLTLLPGGKPAHAGKFDWHPSFGDPAEVADITLRVTRLEASLILATLANSPSETVRELAADLAVQANRPVQ